MEKGNTEPKSKIIAHCYVFVSGLKQTDLILPNDDHTKA